MSKKLSLIGSLNKADLTIQGINYSIRFDSIDKIWRIKRANLKIIGTWDSMQDAINACFEIEHKYS